MFESKAGAITFFGLFAIIVGVWICYYISSNKAVYTFNNDDYLVEQQEFKDEVFKVAIEKEYSEGGMCLVLFTPKNTQIDAFERKMTKEEYQNLIKDGKEVKSTIYSLDYTISEYGRRHSRLKSHEVDLCMKRLAVLGEGEFLESEQSAITRIYLQWLTRINSDRDNLLEEYDDVMKSLGEYCKIIMVYRNGKLV